MCCHYRTEVSTQCHRLNHNLKTLGMHAGISIMYGWGAKLCRIHPLGNCLVESRDTQLPDLYTDVQGAIYHFESEDGGSVFPPKVVCMYV